MIFRLLMFSKNSVLLLALLVVLELSLSFPSSSLEELLDSSRLLFLVFTEGSGLLSVALLALTSLTRSLVGIFSGILTLISLIASGFATKIQFYQDL